MKQSTILPRLFLAIALTCQVAHSLNNVSDNNSDNRRHLRNASAKTAARANSNIKESFLASLVSSSTPSNPNVHPFVQVMETMFKTATKELVRHAVTEAESTREQQQPHRRRLGIFQRNHGITYTRTVTLNDDDSAFHVGFDGANCDSADVYGDTDCHFDWGESVSGKVNATFNTVLKEGDVMALDAKGLMYGLVSVFDWSTSCAACGEECIIEVPKYIPLSEETITISMPPCPYNMGEDPLTEFAFHEHLPDSSPTNGWVSVSLNVNIYFEDGETGERFFELGTSTTLL
eukprot:CAMPEP_0172495998 /NCGR_PEP_ID=MMETSP1066-20121228/79784_1 /TAXON_ID=671091 /ORGANISM="Coscinodiscus wailesii, Strain CCMP2513" /LENGTH=289 /DNA_ID=CAMNT_0013268043 /DNA_START=83 /DNA_END=952 /DNA_ORIENTATION=-